VKVCADTAEDIAALETKIMSVEVHNVDLAAAGELIKDLAGCVHCLYTTSKKLELCACRCPRVSTELHGGY
jgi:hypothetical protein